MTRLIILTILAATSVSAAAAEPTSWNVFRGNTSGSGIATSKLPGTLDVLWKFTAKDTYFEATAAIVDGVVYIGDVDRKMYAIDLKTGKQIWSFPVEIGFTASPAVRDGRVYAGDSDGVFYCLDAKTGKLVWKHQTDGEINSSANFYKDSVLVGSQDGTLFRFQADNGKVIWKYLIKASGGIQCSPTLGESRCFVAGCDGKLHLIDVEKGASLATLEIGDPTLATPAIMGDHVFFGNEAGTFFGINWRTVKVSWTYQHARRRQSIRSSAAAHGDVIVVGGRNKLVHGLDPKDGKQLWTFTTRDRVDSSPVVVGDRVFVGSGDGRLYALALKTGKQLWSYDAGAGFAASPAVADGRLVIGNEDGVLYCFGKKE